MSFGLLPKCVKVLMIGEKCTRSMYVSKNTSSLITFYLINILRITVGICNDLVQLFDVWGKKIFFLNVDWQCTRISRYKQKLYADTQLVFLIF